MRAVINKGNREEDLLARGRVDLQERLVAPQALLHDRAARGAGRGRGGHRRAGEEVPRPRPAARCRRAQGSAAIHLGASTFVPKPFTPFQWEPMITPEETRRRQALITAALGGRNGAIQFKPHDSRQSSIEGALALGDRRVGTAVLAAFRAGQRLDGWIGVVRRGALARGLRRVRAGARRRARLVRAPAAPHCDEVLPWDRIDCGVTKAYLAKQLAAARNLAEVPDCVLAPVQRLRRLRLRGREEPDLRRRRTTCRRRRRPPRPPEPPVRTRVRVRYAKLGRLVALSHLETMHTAPARHPPRRAAGRLLAGLPPEAARLLRPGPAGRGSRARRSSSTWSSSARSTPAEVSTRLARGAAGGTRPCSTREPSTRARPRSASPCAPSTIGSNSTESWWAEALSRSGSRISLGRSRRSSRRAAPPKSRERRRPEGRGDRSEER